MYGMVTQNQNKYDASLMESEVLYKFVVPCTGEEISAYLNAEKDEVVWWSSLEVTADESTWNNKQVDSVPQFTARLNGCGMEHTN